MRDGWRETTLGEITEQTHRLHQVVVGATYRLLGVRWYGQGPFHREDGVGGEIKAPRLFEAWSRDLIYNRLFAWKGSFGIVGPELDGCFVSGEFPLFRVDESQALVEFVNLVMCRPSVWASIERESTGSTATSRNRWKEERFVEWRLLLPPLDEQRRIVDLIAAVDEGIAAAGQEVVGANKAISASANDLINTKTDLVPLGQVASIEARLVDPRLSDNQAMRYLDIEAIESQTGKLRTLSTVRDAQPISAKFHFTRNDVVYSKIRPELRKVAFPRFEGLCSADAYPLRPTPEILPEYLLEVLLSEGFARQAVAKSGRTKMPKVNRRELFSIAVPVPEISLQRDVVSVLDSFRAVASEAAACVEALHALRAALCDDLLSGDHEIPSSYDELLSA
jgi:type I restriction enzyme S subunit